MNIQIAIFWPKSRGTAAPQDSDTEEPKKAPPSPISRSAQRLDTEPEPLPEPRQERLLASVLDDTVLLPKQRHRKTEEGRALFWVILYKGLVLLPFCCGFAKQTAVGVGVDGDVDVDVVCL